VRLPLKRGRDQWRRDSTPRLPRVACTNERERVMKAGAARDVAWAHGGESDDE
jgi:hypothetical protein